MMTLNSAKTNFKFQFYSIETSEYTFSLNYS